MVALKKGNEPVVSQAVQFSGPRLHSRQGEQHSNNEEGSTVARRLKLEGTSGALLLASVVDGVQQ